MGMIKGMTGYGNAALQAKETKGFVEVKSLNGRYFDITYYLPIGYGSLEDKIRRLCQKFMERGRITVSLKITQKKKDEIILNKQVARSYLRHAHALQRQFSIKNDLNLSDMVKLPGVVEIKETSVSADKIWPALEKSLTKALRALEQMRKREGRSLKRDVREKLLNMNRQIRTISARSKTITREMRKQLPAEEFQSYRRSSDINEELSRLRHYVAEMKLLLNKNASVGKRIDFIAQEMQRETNTVGSKLQDGAVSNAVINLKSKIEKIREQAQNIE
jgi:uncharacterized protein (TIGR00255 family)